MLFQKIINYYLIKPIVKRQKKVLELLDRREVLSRVEFYFLKRETQALNFLVLTARILSVITYKSIIFYSAAMILLYVFSANLTQLLINSIWGSVIILTFKLKNFLRVSLILILQPISFTYLALYVAFKLDLHDNVTFFLLLAGIPIFSILTYFDYKNEHQFLDKLRVALEFNNLLFLTIASLSVLYLSSTNNLEQLLPSNLVKLDKEFSPRDFLLFSANFMTFPFIVSNALIKWLLELTSSRSEKAPTN